MNYIKKWSLSIASSVDHLLKNVENHESLVDSAIRESRMAFNSSRVRLHRVIEDGKKMQSTLIDLEKKSASWEERAIRVHSDNEAQALECMKRKRRLDKEIVRLQNELSTHSNLVNQLKNEHGKVEEHIENLKRKKNQLSAREFQAKAVRSMEGEIGGSVVEVEDVLERWEERVILNEYPVVDAFTSEDTLEDIFIEAEEAESLKMELDALLKKS